MEFDLDSLDQGIPIKYKGQSFMLRRPKVKEVKELVAAQQGIEKEDPAQLDILGKYLGRLGMAPEMLDELNIVQLRKIVELITGEGSKKN